jgi:hypothetical protein
MTGPTLRGDRIGHTVIEGAYARKMLTRIQGPMDMAGLTIPHNDEVIFVRRQLTLKSFLKRIRLAGSKAQ